MFLYLYFSVLKYDSIIMCNYSLNLRKWYLMKRLRTSEFTKGLGGKHTGKVLLCKSCKKQD